MANISGIDLYDISRFNVEHIPVLFTLVRRSCRDSAYDFVFISGRLLDIFISHLLFECIYWRKCTNHYILNMQSNLYTGIPIL